MRSSVCSATAIILLYLLMVFRGLRIALTADDDFGKLLAIGLVASFGLQVFVIVAGVTRLIPLRGSRCRSSATAGPAC